MSSDQFTVSVAGSFSGAACRHPARFFHVAIVKFDVAVECVEMAREYRGMDSLRAKIAAQWKVHVLRAVPYPHPTGALTIPRQGS